MSKKNKNNKIQNEKSWFLKFDTLTFKNPLFLHSIFDIQNSIPDISSIDSLQLLDQPIKETTFFYSIIDYESILQKTIHKIFDLMTSFFKAEYSVAEDQSIKDFCLKTFNYCLIEKLYMNEFWTSKIPKAFLTNRIWACYVRFSYFLQEFHKQMLFYDEKSVFLDCQSSKIAFTFESTFTLIDCFALLFVSMLKKINHLSEFIKKEMNFLIRIYNFIVNLKTMPFTMNIFESERKFPERDFIEFKRNLIDMTKMIGLSKHGEQVFELEIEEEDCRVYKQISNESNEKKEMNLNLLTSAEKINNHYTESPTISAETPNSNSPMRSFLISNNASKSKLTKNSSFFFDEGSKDSIKGGNNDQSFGDPLQTKGLLGNTRRSLINENIAMNHDSGNSKTSVFKDEANKKTKMSILYTQSANNEIKSLFSKDNSSNLQNNENYNDLKGIYMSKTNSSTIRNIAESAFNPLHHLYQKQTKLHPQDVESVLRSNLFSNSLNLPSNTLLSSIHPSIIYSRETHVNEKIIEPLKRDESPKLRFRTNDWNNIEESSQNLLQITENQVYSAINEKLNDNLVKLLSEADFTNKRDIFEKKSEKENKSLTKLKSTVKKKKDISMYAKDLDASENPFLRDNEGELTPLQKNGKEIKLIKKQNTIEKEEELANAKLKRKSQKKESKKLGLTEKDFIKIDKTTEIKEKLQYVSFQEKAEENVALDEDIILSTVNDENIDKPHSNTELNYVTALSYQDSEKNMYKSAYRLSNGNILQEENENWLLNERQKIVDEILNDMNFCQHHDEYLVITQKPRKH